MIDSMECAFGIANGNVNPLEHIGSCFSGRFLGDMQLQVPMRVLIGVGSIGEQNAVGGNIFIKEEIH